MADHPGAVRRRTTPAKRVSVRPTSYNSLVAAATVMLRPGQVEEQGKRDKVMPLDKWQTQSGRYYDEIPEYRSGVGWLGNALSRINLVAARPPRNPGDEPQPIDPDDPATTPGERRAVELVNMIAGGPVGQGAMMRGFGEHLSIAGITWLVVEPDLADAEADEFVTWQVLSQENVQRQGDQWKVKDAASADWRDVHPNGLVVKCWRKHPLRPWEPDAPVRALLGVLHQIEVLSESITASATSRLAGSGILAIPSEATFPQVQTRQPSQTDPAPDPDTPEGTVQPGNADDFIETFIQTAIVPIKDRGTPAAVVPLVIQIPGEHLGKIQHLTFERPLDGLTGERLDAAIRRFAIGMDMPPEALLGVGDVNHWTAWQIAESGITLHIEPMAEASVEALTTGWLVPAMQSEAIPATTAMVWYDSTDLRTRPDKSAVTTEAYDRVEASGDALRREMGLDDDDKPSDAERRTRILLDAMKGLPSLAPVVLLALGLVTPEQLAAGMALAAPAAQEPPPSPGPTPAPDPENSPPERPTAPPDETVDPALAAGLLAAADGVVWRALERSGQRLRTQAGRKVGNGESVLDGDPATLHCSVDPTVYADLDFLLDGAWGRVPEIAGRYGIDADALAASLAAYCRALLAAQHAHSVERLAGALGLPCLSMSS